HQLPPPDRRRREPRGGARGGAARTRARWCRQIVRTGPERPRNRFDLAEVGGAFGDLGTLIPFVVAYVGVLKMDATAVLLPFGVALLVVGTVFRTPFPVQPMKAIGATALTHAAVSGGLTGEAVVAAGLVTGAIWLALALTGLATRLARLVPRAALLGVVMGLGFAFMLEGVRMMSGHWLLSAALLAATLAMLSRRWPAMLALLAAGAAIALLRDPSLAARIGEQQAVLRWPAFAWPGLTPSDLWIGALLLALPQLPLTFGNALVA